MRSSIVLALALAATSYAQSLISNLSTKDPGDVDKTQIAIPGGAGAVSTSTGTAGAGPLIGFQVWQQDRFLLSSFFTFSAPQSISGQQHDFGSFMLNPPGQGTSYSFAGNRLWAVCGGAKMKDCEKTEALFLFGIAGRAGITNTKWNSGSGDAAKSIDGSVAYLTPAALFTSRTYRDSKAADANQYQFGASFGPSMRFIANDLGQRQNAQFRQQVFGTDRKTLKGWELEFFVRMNQFQPYVRFSHFSLPNQIDISGFSGAQVVFGVNVLSSVFQKTI
jgi:hypothetical protein